MQCLGQLTDKQANYSPADSEAHGYEHPEDDELPVAGAEADQEAGQGEGQGAHGQHHRPGQPLIQQVRQDGQEHGGEDEHQDEGGASQHLEIGGITIKNTTRLYCDNLSILIYKIVFKCFTQ